MGTMIAGEAWLLTMAEQGGHHREIAARILRMQILTTNRTGHVLFLAWAPYRDQIAASASWGRLAGIVVECADCHCQALLSDWERAAKMTTPQRKDLYNQRRPRLPRASLMFLAKCPGSEVSALAAASAELPRKEG